MLCFYGDTVMAAILWTCTKVLGKGMNNEALNPASAQVFGILAHGFGHMMIGLNPKTNDPMETGLDREFSEAVKGFLFL